jgi:hypothetical protein
VGCAADLGNDTEDAAIPHQLVRESGGMSVRRGFPATLAFVRARCWCACGWDSVGDVGGPLTSLSARDFMPRQMSRKRSPMEPRAGIVWSTDPLVFKRRELCSALI